MSSFKKLIRRYPQAEIVEVIERMDEDNFLRVKNKLDERHIEGGTVGVVWLNETDIVLTKRTRAHPGWALPGGRIETGEDFESGFLRELDEETTVKAAINDIIVIEQKVFISPAGEKRQLTLVFFEASAHPNQTPITTDDAKEEGLTIKKFHIDKLPEKMITNDREKIHHSVKKKRKKQ